MVHNRYFAADADFEDERARLRLLEQVHDPTTMRHLMRIGVDEGWRCLEVGAGGGSIGSWLAEQVGAAGHVVATDIDPRFLNDLNVLENVEVRRHNIIEDSLEASAYDLVHCRAVLSHLLNPAAAATAMVRALRRGGWLLAEEGDFTVMASVDDTHPLAGRFNTALRKRFEFSHSTGTSYPYFGRALPPLVARLDLLECGNEASTSVIQGGTPAALFAEKTIQRLDEVMLEKGALTEAEVADRQRALVDPTFWFVDVMTVAAWGRRPA
jgi:ubiquinone/menaquinone biosynthesis C-methylase UbiE